MARALGGSLTPLDVTGAADLTPDFDILTPDGRHVALEVTSTADQAVLSLQATAFGKQWSAAGLTGSTGASTSPSRSVVTGQGTPVDESNRPPARRPGAQRRERQHRGLPLAFWTHPRIREQGADRDDGQDRRTWSPRMSSRLVPPIHHDSRCCTRRSVVASAPTSTKSTVSVGIQS